MEQQTYWENTVMTTFALVAAGAILIVVGIAAAIVSTHSDPLASHRRAVHRAGLTFLSSAPDARSKGTRADPRVATATWGSGSGPAYTESPERPVRETATTQRIPHGVQRRGVSV
jgi:hypothetical protein